MEQHHDITILGGPIEVVYNPDTEHEKRVQHDYIAETYISLFQHPVTYLTAMVRTSFFQHNNHITNIFR